MRWSWDGYWTDVDPATRHQVTSVAATGGMVSDLRLLIGYDKLVVEGQQSWREDTVSLTSLVEESVA